MITDQDITRLKKVFATKDDLKSLVTKEDHDRQYNYLVSNMATKTDLANLEGRFDDLKESFNKIMNAVDALAGMFLDLRQEMAFSGAQYSRQVEWNHKVAKKVGIPFDY